MIIHRKRIVPIQLMSPQQYQSGVQVTPVAPAAYSKYLFGHFGDSDYTADVSGSINMVEAINALHPELKAKLTIYPGVGHNSWSRTYNSTGMGTESPQYDPFDQSIYTWMYSHTKGSRRKFNFN